MTSTVKTVEILTTMEEDPHVNFFPWEMDIHDTAAGMATSLHPLGLLSAILTDEQWALYPGNTVTDANGQVQVLARFDPKAYVQEHVQMTNVELYVAKSSNDRLQLWIDSSETLKRAVIKSLGENRSTSRPRKESPFPTPVCLGHHRQGSRTLWQNAKRHEKELKGTHDHYAANCGWT